MDGEHIEMMINGWASSDLRKRATIELGRMREELYVLRQFSKTKTEFCDCAIPDFVPFLECSKCGKPPRIDDMQPETKLKICSGKDETQLDIALSGHKYHCPNCDIHLTSLGFCSNCGVRFDIPERKQE